MLRATKGVTVVAAAVLLSACHSPTDEASTLDLTGTPNPAPAQPASGVFYTIRGDSTHPDQTLQYPWVASFTCIAKQTGGVGMSITGVAVKVQQATGGIVTPPTTGDVEHYQFTSHASGNRLEKNGTASVDFQVWYDLPNKGREALATVTFSLYDDNNFSITKTVSVQME
jgi:hypothetical protein